MNPDHFANQGMGWVWDDMIQEPTDVDNCLLFDGANAMPDQYLFQSQLNNNMAAGASTASVPKTEDPRDRKRINDKAYRDRERDREKRQEEELKMLAEENARLKDKNESLVKERDTNLIPKLESAANEINQLKINNRNLKRTSDNQEIYLHALAEKMASRDKIKSLEDEVARLREIVVVDPRMQEKKQLMEAILRLKNENSLLELQNQGYCMMIQKERLRGDQDEVD